MNSLNKQFNENKLQHLEEIIATQKMEIHRLKSIINDLPGSIYWKDMQGVYLGRNKKSGENMQKFGFPWQWNAIIGKTDYDLFNQEMADRFRENDLEVMESGKEFAKEEVLTLPSGQQITQLLTKRPLWDEKGNIVGIVGNTIDITYLKKIENALKDAKEKAEATNKAKTEFLANMRHDIRTPLIGMIGLANIIIKEASEPNIKNCANNLLISGHALLDLLNEVLEIIKIVSGDFPIFKKKFDFKSTLNEVIMLNQAAAHQKNLALLFEHDSTIPSYLIGDPFRYIVLC